MRSRGRAGAAAARPSSGGSSSSPPMRSPGWSGIAPVAIDEHGAQPAARRARDVVVEAVADHHRRLGRRAARARAPRRRSSRTACAGRARARRARSRRRCRAARRTPRARDRCSRRARPCSALARRTSSSGSDVGEELEVARVAPLLLGRDPDLLGLAGPRAHAAHDLDREAAVLRAAVLERLDVARRAARPGAPARSARGSSRTPKRAPSSA